MGPAAGGFDRSGWRNHSRRYSRRCQQSVSKRHVLRRGRLDMGFAAIAVSHVVRQFSGLQTGRDFSRRCRHADRRAGDAHGGLLFKNEKSDVLKRLPSRECKQTEHALAVKRKLIGLRSPTKVWLPARLFRKVVLAIFL